MARGLDKAGRQYVRELVDRQADGDFVVSEIRRLVKSRDWDYNANQDFVRWLHRKGWKITSEYLWNHISGGDE
jgi:hypothetical protein